MPCSQFCTCLLCRELKGCEKDITPVIHSDNFILSKPPNKPPIKECFDNKKYTFFGMDLPVLSDLPQLTSEVQKKSKDEVAIENKHKSVIYVNNENVNQDNCNDTKITTIKIEEKIDEFMSLDAVENSDVINVVFKNTFSLASQILEDVRTCNDYFSDSPDEFPLGMEADLLCQYMEQQR